MCGIAGLVLARPASDEALAARVQPMNAALAHRGPDGEGVWTEAEAGVALAQRRLAIVDLSPTGAQPMLSASGRYAMTYNGEIYNFRELRQELEAAGGRFRGTSDSEVLLEAWDAWGPDRTLQRLNGMFAIAIFDRRERTLTLARDRLGIKPLLFMRTGEGLFFASELKGLLKEPSCPRTIDPGAVAAYLRHGCVPAPWTIFEGVRKLQPGEVMVWAQGREPETRRFWGARDAMEQGDESKLDAPFDDLTASGETLIADAVERQMVADVPLGAFLSGGIDSSLVAALMQRASGRKIDTFTIGFEEKAWDESPHAAAVASHLGTRHHTLMTSGRAAIDLAAGMASVYDEPFADSSQIPTTLLCRMVRQHVTVALSGDGGDESFAGYQRHQWGLTLDSLQRRVPRALRRAASLGLRAAPRRVLDAAGSLAGIRHGGHKLERAAGIAEAPDFISGYRSLTALTMAPESLAPGAVEKHPFAFKHDALGSIDTPLSRMQLIDVLSYLPDDILTKVDRASMSCGLEVRVPLLDHRIWEWAARLPEKARMDRGRGKVLLRAILARHVPPVLTERPKAGFAVPLAQWLRGALRPFAESLLTPSSLSAVGALDAVAIGRLWTEHQAGRHDHGPVLWAILMLLAWRDGLDRA